MEDSNINIDFVQAGEYDNAGQDTTPQDSNADSLHIRQIPEFQHANLKKVSIQRFSSAKSLIELTCQIIENTPSLRCLELNTTRDLFPSSWYTSGYKEPHEE